MVSPPTSPVPEPLDNLPVGIEKCKLAANSSSSPKSAGILCGNVEVRGQLVAALFLSTMGGPGHQSQFLRLGSKCPYFLHHLTGPMLQTALHLTSYM